MRIARWLLTCALVSGGCTGGDGTAGEAGEPGADGLDGTDGRDARSPDVGSAVQDALDEQLEPALAGALDGALTPAAKGCDELELEGDSEEFAATFAIGSELESGREVEVCQLFQVGPEDLWVNSSQLAMNKGSHHGLLWLTGMTEMPTEDIYGDPLPEGVFPCESGPQDVVDTEVVIAGSQGRTNITERGRMPEDVAIKVPANSVVVMNYHMLNASDETLDSCMKVGLRTMEAKDVEHEAGVMFFYDPLIAVPAKGESRSRTACPITHDLTLVTAVSHMHKQGDDYRATWLSGDPFAEGTEVVQELYATQEWEEPEDRIFEEPLQLQKGDFIDYWCHYTNDRDVPVAQGLDTTDEMCMFIGLYYPATMEQSFCGENGNELGYRIGSGQATGGEFLTCLWESPFDFEVCGREECANYSGRFDTYNCFEEACEEAGEFARSYLNCTGEQVDDCQQECTDVFQTACASIPAAQGGCAEAFGPLEGEGATGTCAQEAQAEAVTLCTSGAQASAIAVAAQTASAAACDPDAEGYSEETCAASVTAQVKVLTGACVAQEVPALAETCITECFGGCIKGQAFACTEQCVNEACQEPYESLLGVDCE